MFNSTTQSVDPFPALDAIIKLVKESAEIITQLSQGDIKHEVKGDGSFVTDVDEEIQRRLMAELNSKWPQFGFIGEEMSYDNQVLVCEQCKEGYWVLDPLDGTTNFTSGFLFFGVSLALVVEGVSVLGVVYDPIRDECFSAHKGNGAYLNGKPLVCPETRLLSDCVANVDYKRLLGELSSQLVRCPPYRSQRNLGSSVLEWCWLAAGRVQLYLHGGQKLWDFAAGYLILQEAGGVATSLSGKPLDCSKLRKRSVVAAVNLPLLDQWVEWIDSNSEISQSEPY